jgi:hypothetical protein
LNWGCLALQHRKRGDHNGNLLLPQVLSHFGEATRTHSPQSPLSATLGNEEREAGVAPFELNRLHVVRNAKTFSGSSPEPVELGFCLLLPGKAVLALCSKTGDKNIKMPGYQDWLTFESFSGTRRVVLVWVEFEGQFAVGLLQVLI